MKNIKFIIFFLLLSFLGHAFTLKTVNSAKLPVCKESGQHIKSKKISIEFFHGTTKLKRKNRPKKPKGIKVIVPDLPLLVFHKFSGYKDFTAREAKGSVFLFLFDTQGKRGPPSGFAS